MSIYLIVGRPIKSLFPMERKLEVGMLPLAGRPLIEHTLATLSKLTDVLTVVLPRQMHRTRRWLEGTSYPELRIILIEPEAVKFEGRALVILGDTFIASERVTEAHNFWKEAKLIPASFAEYGIYDTDIGDGVPSWKNFQGYGIAGATEAEINCLTPAIYHQLAIDSVGGKVPGVDPAGWLDPDGLRAGNDARILTRNAPGDNCSIGANSFIDRDVTLANNVIVGDNSIVGCSTYLENSIVLPDVCVGKHLCIRNAIVGPDWIYRIDLDQLSDLAKTGTVSRVAA